MREPLTRLRANNQEVNAYVLQDASSRMAVIVPSRFPASCKCPRTHEGSVSGFHLIGNSAGDDIAGAISGGHVFTRHRKVADAVLAEVEIN